MEKFILNIKSKYPNITIKRLIISLIALLLLISILIIVFINYNKNTIDMNYFKSLYTNPASLTSIVDNQNLNANPLNKFFIKTAYNCCCTGSYKDGYVDLEGLKLCIAQGVRCLDFEIYSINNIPVVAAGSKNDYTNTDRYNSIPISSVLNIITQQAFSTSKCSNFNDPLILHFRIMNNNPKMYENFSKIISQSQELNSYLLEKKYNHEYDGNNLTNIPIKLFKKKIIIVIYGENTFYQSTPLDEFINIASGQAFMHLLRFNQIKYNQNNELIEFNRNKMSIILPDTKEDTKNPNFNLSRTYGCQLIGMAFQNNDINLKQYNLYFKNNKSAFVLKPKQLM